MRILAARRCVLGVLGVLALAACSRTGSEPTALQIEKAPNVSAAARATGERLYRERCAQCHGNAGGGDGLMAQAVRPRPQRLSDRMWQANASNARLRKVLVYGGGAVNKSTLMPANPDLAQQPEAVDALIAVIRGFAEQ